MPVKKESSEKQEEESLETKKLKNWPLVSLEKNKYCNPHLYYVFVGESKVSFIHLLILPRCSFHYNKNVI